MVILTPQLRNLNESSIIRSEGDAFNPRAVDKKILAWASVSL